jgi:hypothetical protein
MRISSGVCTLFREFLLKEVCARMRGAICGGVRVCRACCALDTRYGHICVAEWSMLSVVLVCSVYTVRGCVCVRAGRLLYDALTLPRGLTCPRISLRRRTEIR